MRSQLSEIIYEYVRDNPECTITEVAQNTGASRNYVSILISRFRRQGLVIASLVPGSKQKIALTAIETAREPNQTIERARQIGHPFGIVAAQVMA